MENLPFEVIGNILSHLRSARDVVIASATCKNWREGWRCHLHTLSFNSSDWPLYHELTSNTLAIIITRTIFQTKALQCLVISMDDVHKFSVESVNAWLMCTRESLRRLYFNVRTSSTFNIIEICGWQKLEVLSLSRNSITHVDPSYQKFPCLKSLSLRFVNISPLNLSLLLTACPSLEILYLVRLDIAMSVSQASMKLSSSSLKKFYVDSSGLNKFVLEADLLEYLHLKNRTFGVFELIGKGTLKVLKLDDASAMRFYIEENLVNLEIVDVSNYMIMWPTLYKMISKATKLHKLRLWGAIFEEDDKIVDLETISVSFPELRHLSLSYDLRDGVLEHSLKGSSHLMNVTVLELGWTSINDLFSEWVRRHLERCPSLEKLVIHGFVSNVKTPEEYQNFAKFTEFIVQLGRDYTHIKIEFEYA